MKEVIKDDVKYLHVDSSHLFGRKLEDHFEILLGCLLGAADSRIRGCSSAYTKCSK